MCVWLCVCVVVCGCAQLCAVVCGCARVRVCVCVCVVFDCMAVHMCTVERKKLMFGNYSYALVTYFEIIKLP